MKSYSELSELPAEAYLDPANFTTSHDSLAANQKYEDKQYRQGLRTGKAALYITLSFKGVWGAVMKGGGSVRSYEGIGYHAHTAALLRGFLDSGVDIDVTRIVDDKLMRFTLKQTASGKRTCKRQNTCSRL